MAEGIIIKALSGFYYVADGGEIISCRAKGRFRLDSTSPLVGDHVAFTRNSESAGVVDAILPRKNAFIRPAVANIDALVFVASAAKPVTDPYLIDRVSVIADRASCETIVCINKCDLRDPEELSTIYQKCGFPTVCTSAVTGEGVDQLRRLMQGKVCAFAGDSGIGKSSLLNCLIPGLALETTEISEKLGRGRHTTRHIEFYPLDEETFLADTPGFASFEVQMVDHIEPEELQFHFREFAPFLGGCRFDDCRHLSEPECAVREAVQKGEIPFTRHESYKRLYDLIKTQSRTYN